MEQTDQKSSNDKIVMLTTKGEAASLDISPETCAKVCAEYGFPTLMFGEQASVRCTCGCKKIYEIVFMGVGVIPKCTDCHDTACPENNLPELCFVHGPSYTGVKFLKRGQATI